MLTSKEKLDSERVDAYAVGYVIGMLGVIAGSVVAVCVFALIGPTGTRPWFLSLIPYVGALWAAGLVLLLLAAQLSVKSMTSRGSRVWRGVLRAYVASWLLLPYILIIANCVRNAYRPYMGP